MASINFDVKRDIITSNPAFVQLLYHINEWTHYVQIPRPLVTHSIFRMPKRPSAAKMNELVQHNMQAFDLIEKWLIDNPQDTVLKFGGQYTMIDLDSKIYERQFITRLGQETLVYDKQSSKAILTLLSKLQSPAAVLLAVNNKHSVNIVFSSNPERGYAGREETTLKELVTKLVRKK